MRETMRRRLLPLAAAVAALAMSPQLGALDSLPERWVLRPGAVAALPVSAAVRASVSDEAVAALRPGKDGGVALAAGGQGESELTFRLLGLLPVKRVTLAVEPEKRLIPGGQSVGVALNTDGVVVVGSSDLGRTASPARLAGLKSGDVIQKVDGEAVRQAAALSACLASGRTVTLDVLRDGDSITCQVTPAVDSRDGLYKLGAWVRSSTAGVGTLTYYDPDSGRFGALGHAITDVDTGVVMPVGEGALYENRVVMVTPSKKGSPGELTGDFFADARQMGSVEKNTELGVFGQASSPGGEAIPVAARSEVHPGDAVLRTTVDGGGVRDYACVIEKVSPGGGQSTRSLVIRVTDPALLKTTGGIVQGMSGSPIIQDGRLAGAVTHVMVNQPAMGYGVLIEEKMGEEGVGNRQ